MNQPSLIPATLADYPAIQNMARFYVYDLSRECGFISDDWALPADGLYESFDFKRYFQDPSRKAYLVKVADELAGFVLLNQVGAKATTNWNMGEFFILAKFQGKGIGRRVACQIWDLHPGVWEVSVIPENRSAFSFWHQVITAYTGDAYHLETKDVTFDVHQPQRRIFTFTVPLEREQRSTTSVIIRSACVQDIPALVALSYAKRRSYEKAQPQFWKYAGPHAEEVQSIWFEELLGRDDHIMLVAAREGRIDGFVIAKQVSAPKVYDPGGVTLMVDDFCVAEEREWQPVGGELLTALKASANAKKASQLLVVCGAHDTAKRKFLKSIGLTVVSEWFVCSL